MAPTESAGSRPDGPLRRFDVRLEAARRDDPRRARSFRLTRDRAATDDHPR